MEEIKRHKNVCKYIFGLCGRLFGGGPLINFEDILTT
jgi:hypothetical protein